MVYLLLTTSYKKSMIISTNYRIVEVADEYMAVPIGSEASNFHGVIALSEAAAFLLRKMNISRSRNDLKEFLLEEYDVEETVAEKDIDRVIKEFLEYGLIEE